MKIHEYQAKALLRAFGVAVPRGEVAETPAQARDAAQRLGGKVVVKAQVHAGGRGKAGGIKLADDPAGAENAARQILGMMLKTARTPEKILREWTHPTLGLGDFQARRLAFGLGLAADQLKQGVALMRNLFALYLAKDCSLAEINPLVTTKDGRVFALDAKLSFDDNALFRQQDVAELRDVHEEDPLDVEASKYGLNYIKLDGNVGCMVNGAGLAMATMDIVKLAE